jgi:hypothetical protein
MKKISLLRLLASLVLVLLGVEVYAQNNEKWEAITTPQSLRTGITSAVVTDDSRIFAFGGNKCSVSSDFGKTWESSIVPYEFSGSGSSSVVFKGQVYLATDDGLISSVDGSNWEMRTSPGSHFSKLAANDKFAFAVDYDQCYRTTDGIVWEKIQGLDAEQISTICADGDTIRVVSLNSTLDDSYSVVSYDNGENWITKENLGIISQSVDAYQGQWNVVGLKNVSDYVFDTDLSSRGQFNFDYSSGALQTTHYFAGRCWMGGYCTKDDKFSAGIIMADGELSSLDFIGNSDIVLITSNRKDLALALASSGQMFILKNGMVSAVQPGISAATVATDFLSVYPNPTTGSVTVKTGMLTKMIEVRSLHGVLIKQYPVNSNELKIDLPQAAGIYLLNGHRVIKQ